MAHYHDPQLSAARLLLILRKKSSYSYGGYYGHAGLSCNALQTVKVLREHKVCVSSVEVDGVKDLQRALALSSPLPTHCLIEVPWLKVGELEELCGNFPSVHFLVRTHSQIGFLQVEPGTIQNLRDALLLQERVFNLSVAANSERLCEYLRVVYQGACLYLPNLYDVARTHRKRDEHNSPRSLRIGLFGALRLLKNHTTACAAAQLMAKERGADLEVYITTGRGEAGEKNSSVYRSLQVMCADLPWCTLIEKGWSDWPTFRRLVSHMDILVQPSFSETMNICTADAVTEGVPVVVSEAIDWVPGNWVAQVDSASDIARVGSMLLSSHHEAARGLEHLKKFMRQSLFVWKSYLAGNPAAVPSE